MSRKEDGAGTSPRWLALGAIWLGVVLIWSFLVAVTGNRPLTVSVRAGFVMMGAAGIMSLGTWWISSRFAWPERRRSLFFIIHAAASITFSLVLVLLDAALGAYTLNDTIVNVLRYDGGFIWWEIVSYIWLYGLVAGICYSLRTRRRLAEQRVAAATAESLASRMQLKALRAQINPHFLFNALHSLSALVRHNPDAAEEALDRLGELLRYALDGDDRGGTDERIRKRRRPNDGIEEDDVYLADEWRFVTNYLALEQLRLADRLRVMSDISAEALDCVVPSFVLQPLVENAVKHGISPRTEGGTVMISAGLRDDRLRLEVSDDGPGAAAAAAAGASNGFGLAALRRRIETRYPSEAALTVETAPGKGFHVTVVLPIRPAREPVND